jgi:hypothetical protein
MESPFDDSLDPRAERVRLAVCGISVPAGPHYLRAAVVGADLTLVSITSASVDSGGA